MIGKAVAHWHGRASYLSRNQNWKKVCDVEPS
jgi:hypothetical protein